MYCIMLCCCVQPPGESAQYLAFAVFFCGFFRGEEAVGRGRGGYLRLPIRENQRIFAMDGCYC